MPIMWTYTPSTFTIGKMVPKNLHLPEPPYWLLQAWKSITHVLSVRMPSTPAQGIARCSIYDPRLQTSPRSILATAAYLGSIHGTVAWCIFSRFLIPLLNSMDCTVLYGGKDLIEILNLLSLRAERVCSDGMVATTGNRKSHRTSQERQLLPTPDKRWSVAVTREIVHGIGSPVFRPLQTTQSIRRMDEQAGRMEGCAVWLWPKASNIDRRICLLCSRSLFPRWTGVRHLPSLWNNPTRDLLALVLLPLQHDSHYCFWAISYLELLSLDK